MTEDQRQLGLSQVAVDDVKVRATYGTGTDAQKQLSGGRARLWNIAQDKRASWFFQNHRTHVDLITRAGEIATHRERKAASLLIAADFFQFRDRRPKFGGAFADGVFERGALIVYKQMRAAAAEKIRDAKRNFDMVERL